MLEKFSWKWQLPGIFQVLLLKKTGKTAEWLHAGLCWVVWLTLCRDSLLVCSVKALKWCSFLIYAPRRDSMSRSTDWPKSPRAMKLHKQFLSVAAFLTDFWLIMVPPWSYLSRVLCTQSCEAYGACSFLHWDRSITGLPLVERKNKLTMLHPVIQRHFSSWKEKNIKDFPRKSLWATF